MPYAFLLFLFFICILSYFYEFFMYNNKIIIIIQKKTDRNSNVVSICLAQSLKLFGYNFNLEHLVPASMLEAVFCFLFASGRVDDGLAGRHAISLSSDNRFAVVPRVGQVGQDSRRQNNCKNIAVCTCIHNITPRADGHVCALHHDVVAIDPFQICNLLCGHNVAAQPKNLSHVFFLHT